MMVATITKSPQLAETLKVSPINPISPGGPYGPPWYRSNRNKKLVRAGGPGFWDFKFYLVVHVS